MQAILSVTVPFFALILAGWLAAQRRVLPEVAIPGLNAFVLFFALPCMLFRFGMSTPVLELLNPGVLLVYLLSATVIVFFTVTMTLSSRINLKNAAFGALVAAFPNTGFMGVPLLVALLGPAASGPVICAVLADMIVTSSVCLGIAQMQPPGKSSSKKSSSASRQPKDSPRAAMWRAARGALSNPLPWSIALGAVVGVSGWQPPGPVLKVITMLADAATPVALFTIGAVLWRSGRQAAPGRPSRLSDVPVLTAETQLSTGWHLSDASGRPLSRQPEETLPAKLLRAGREAQRRAPLSSYLPVALIKLLLHPLVVLVLGSTARGLGLPLSGFQLMVLTLAAGLPSASNVSLLAERHGADNGRVARIILSSTLLAFFSFTLLAWLFGVNPQPH